MYREGTQFSIVLMGGGLWRNAKDREITLPLYIVELQGRGDLSTVFHKEEGELYI